MRRPEKLQNGNLRGPEEVVGDTDNLFRVDNPKAVQRTTKQLAAAAGKRFLPATFIDEIRKYRTYSRMERPLYLKLRILDALGLGFRQLPPLQRCRSVVFVCFGNIIRSPMCEALMVRELTRVGRAQFSVASAGLNATHGRAAHPWAIAAARELGISLEQHRARLLTDQIVNEADIIFAMDLQNYVQLATRWPTSQKKIFMLGVYTEAENKIPEIADPFYLGPEQTRVCYQILNSCIQKLVSSL
ncbi:MAG: hypothetical protein JOZ80_00225 [Acidobacteriaceae bacterium]|nr:hypothetical protein [Acidobacteriaceae bacterium]